jgi:hypothetical protein
MNVYEKQERQQKTSLGQQRWNAKRDQDLENAVGLKCQENGVVVLTLKHIPLLHPKLGTRNEIKT